MLSLIVLSPICLVMCMILSYSIPNFAEIFFIPNFAEIFFMVGKLGQFLLDKGGGGCQQPPFCLILGPRRQLQSENFFHGQMPQGKCLQLKISLE